MKALFSSSSNFFLSSTGKGLIESSETSNADSASLTALRHLFWFVYVKTFYILIVSFELRALTKLSARSAIILPIISLPSSKDFGLVEFRSFVAKTSSCCKNSGSSSLRGVSLSFLVAPFPLTGLIVQR